MARHDNLETALEFVVQAHKGQLRDGESPLPYATHPVEVVANLRYIGGVKDGAVIAAGFLHDVLEETQVTSEEIEKAFGKRVRSLVDEVTRYEPTEAETKGMTEDEIYHLRSDLLLNEISKMSPEAQTIKLADRLSNVIGAKATKPKEKQERYIEQTRKMLRIIPKAVNPSLWTAVRKAADIKKREI
ncbi:MAG: HD domain-containing protein [Fimbriimonadales bacterium]